MLYRNTKSLKASVHDLLSLNVHHCLFIVSLYISGGMKKWKLASILGGIPCFAVVWINTYLKEQEHHAHFERPEFVPYEHLRIRTKVNYFDK